MKPPQTQLDGRSLAAVLRDAKASSPHENHALHWQVGAGPNADWAVREGDWKLIGNTRDNSDGHLPVKITRFLINLKTDPAETANLAHKYPDILEHLQQLHHHHLD